VEYWSTGVLGTGVLGYWGIGVWGYWSTGVLGYWGTGVLGYWGIGVLEYWSIGVLEYGVLEYWSIGVLEYWSIGVLEYCGWGRPRTEQWSVPEKLGSFVQLLGKDLGRTSVAIRCMNRSDTLTTMSEYQYYEFRKLT
jgi:hypothetical protein